MKALKYVMMGIALLMTVAACKDDESYADQKKKERKAIAAFLARDPLVLLDPNGDTILNIPKINPISQEKFEAQDSMTDVSKNEFVLFGQTGIYMQIVRKGVGEKLKHGDAKRIICRYREYSILGDSLCTTDRTDYWATSPEILDVSNNSGTITASFYVGPDPGAMYIVYGSSANSTTVPKGWIVPLSYINIGRQIDEEGIALVRLIVPHSEGTATATSNVAPFFYEISYQAMRD